MLTSIILLIQNDQFYLQCSQSDYRIHHKMPTLFLSYGISLKGILCRFISTNWFGEDDHVLIQSALFHCVTTCKHQQIGKQNIWFLIAANGSTCMVSHYVFHLFSYPCCCPVSSCLDLILRRILVMFISSCSFNCSNKQTLKTTKCSAI